MLLPHEIASLRTQAALGRTLDDALATLPRSLPRNKMQRALARAGVRFKRRKQPLRTGQWVAKACRDYHPDDMDARMSNRERARLRYRVNTMGMKIDAALSTSSMTPAEKGRLGALKRWGKPLVVEDQTRQLTWEWL